MQCFDANAGLKLLAVGINAKDIGLSVQIEIIAVALEVDIHKKRPLCENKEV